MRQAKARQKSTFSAVVRNADGSIKRDYGVVCRTHPNALINWTYAQYYAIKRKAQDIKHNKP